MGLTRGFFRQGDFDIMRVQFKLFLEPLWGGRVSGTKQAKNGRN